MDLKVILEKHRLWLLAENGGERANLSGANLPRASLPGANLSGANLPRANLPRANLCRAYLFKANLSGADLSFADLRSANLSGADLSSANLSSANLSGADLSEANLSGTIMENKFMIEFQFNKHRATFYSYDRLTIGCEDHNLKYWLNNFKEIGQANNYSEDEIKLYANFIKTCAKMIGIKK
jgi:hypothetical protein